METITIPKKEYDQLKRENTRLKKALAEPHPKPEYLEKLARIEKEESIRFKDIEDLKNHIEHA